MTPAELAIYADAWADTQRQTAYLQAITIRAMIGSMLSGKRAPAYRSLFGGADMAAAATQKQDGPMTDQQMLEVVKALNRMFGGDVVTTEGGDNSGGST